MAMVLSKNTPLLFESRFIHPQRPTVWLEESDVYVCRDGAGKKASSIHD